MIFASSMLAAILASSAGAKGDGPTTIAVGAGAVWVGLGNGTLRRIDPATRRVGPPIRVGGWSVHDLAAGFGWVWAAAGEGGGLVRINPRTGRVRQIFPSRGTWPTSVEVGAGAVWVSGGDRDSILRYDPNRCGSASPGASGSSPQAPAESGPSWFRVEVRSADRSDRVASCESIRVERAPSSWNATSS
ncbi:MAG: hypothetical protein ABR583_12470 [Gaiellaceae bacterium]